MLFKCKFVYYVQILEDYVIKFLKSLRKDVTG